MCDNNDLETNEHYLMKCNKYNQQRKLMKKNTREDFRRMKMDFNTENLLGMNQKIMMSKKLCEKYKPEIMNIYN